VNQDRNMDEVKSSRSNYTSENNSSTLNPSTSKLAMVSFLMSLLGWFIFLGFKFFLIFSEKAIDISTLITTLIFSPWLFASVLGIIALLKIKHITPVVAGRRLAILGICISAIPLILLIWVQLLTPIAYSSEIKLISCGRNMLSIGQALKSYANEHNGQLPTASQWCDLLISEANVPPEAFICPGSKLKVGQSSYVLNENIVGQKLSDIPPDIVLLFESFGGWNKIGGMELLSTENHPIRSSENCNILLADGQVKVYKKRELHKLRWKP